MENQGNAGTDYVKQCAICCNEGAFATFLKEKHPEAWSTALRDNEEALKDPEAKKVPTPTRAVYVLLNIKSRTELRTDPAKAEVWSEIHGGYQLWLSDV